MCIRDRDTVCHNLVNLIGSRQLSFAVLLQAGADDGAYVIVPLSGNDTLRIVVHLLLTGFDVLFNVVHHLFGDCLLYTSSA